MNEKEGGEWRKKHFGDIASCRVELCISMNFGIAQKLRIIEICNFM